MTRKELRNKPRSATRAPVTRPVGVEVASGWRSGGWRNGGEHETPPGPSRWRDSVRVGGRGR